MDRDYIFFGDEDDDEKELDEYDPRRYGKDMLVPTNAPTWTLRAVPTGAFREDGSGGMAGELSAAAKRFDLGAGIFTDRSNFGSYSNAAVDDGDELDGKDDGPGGVGLAEMLWLLAASGGLRALKGADTVSRLASAEYWDEVGSNYDESDGFGVADPPRVPPESVLQDVLRDVFDTGGAGRKARKTSGGKDSNTASMGNQSAKNANAAESLFPTPRKSAPAHSLLARVALHAMQFGNVRAVAMLWQRFVREVRFAHWDRGVPLPRAENSDENSENSGNDFPETAPDVLACVLHQKLQMLNACIHRRVARREAEFAESGVSALGPTPLAGMVIKSAIRQDSVETQNWEDANGGRLERRPRRRARRVERSVSDERRRRVGRPGRRHRPGVHARRRDRR